MALLGRDGLRNIALINFERSEKLANLINSVSGFQAPKFKNHFNEFVVISDFTYEKLYKHLRDHGIQIGYNLQPQFQELGNATLWATTELHTQEDYEILKNALEVLE